MCMLPVLGPRYLKSKHRHHLALCANTLHITNQCKTLLCLRDIFFLPFLIFEVLERQVYNFLD